MQLLSQLNLTVCPHCGVNSPSLNEAKNVEVRTFEGQVKFWSMYICQRCAGAVVAYATKNRGDVVSSYPQSRTADDLIPEPARTYLSQAIDSIHAPSGSILLCASCVDAMLKEKGYEDGTLYIRIDAAAKDHLITDGMKKWAHKVRLDANEQRHADKQAGLPDSEDAKNTLEFALALAEFLFVLPAKVERGISASDQAVSG